MRQRLGIIIGIGVVLLALIGLNAASYVEIEKTPDTEYEPDRSTYNAGATGTRALYDFLQESGREVTRWREQTAALVKAGGAKPKTFVLLQPKIPLETEEIESLLLWVERGGRLVIIDRRPNPRLLPPSGNWRIATELKQYPTPDAQPDNPEAMTAGVPLARPAQPTSLTSAVETVLPSRFAALIHIWQPDEERAERAARAGKSAKSEDDEEAGAGEEAANVATVRSEDDSPAPEGASEEPPPPAPGTGPRAEPSPIPRAAPSPQPKPAVRPALESPAPIVHLAGQGGPLLADYPHGAGRIIILSDPFIVANTGLARADNLQLALNLVAGGGLTAFDEYHQGHTIIRNEMIAYFEGTPILAALGQATLLVLLVLWTRGRRFARPLPLAVVDRRSSLEFVASMAELQERARAYDLAIENIYTRTRRVLARYAGVEHNSTRAEIAARVAARSSLNREQLETLMRDCEETIQGGPTNARRSLELVKRLREVERTLGLRMRSREIKQAKDNFGF
ncbi:MAG TPA: DUF4350 domain-containing protein [Pyrinomonadaceae bacterium]|jgi:hypothetical protein